MNKRRSHDWRVERRLVSHRLFGEGRSKAGNSMESRIRGIPSRLGLANWSKKLRFMVRLRRWFQWLLSLC